MARRVFSKMLEDYGVDRIRVLAYGTEVDFARRGVQAGQGMVALTLEPAARA
jgi:hypothetical protein